MHTYITQITKEDIAQSSTLERSDKGKYVLIINGAMCGFWDTLEEAQTAQKETTQQPQ